MTTKMYLAALLVCLVLWFKPTPRAKADPTKDIAVTKPLDSSVHKSIDSVKTIKAESKMLQSKLEDKVDELKDQQKELVKVQRQLDSVQQNFAQR